MRWSRPVKIGSRGGDRRGRPDRVPAHPGQTADTDAEPVTVVTPERVLTLTDGVVAIALTLLVLDLTAIDVHGSSVGGLWRALDDEGGRFVAYFIAFWVIAQFWLLHRRVFRRVTRDEDILAVRNYWFLFGISLVPFTTMVLGQTTDNPLAVTLFSANLLLISLSLTWLARTAEQAGASQPVSDERQLLMTRARRIATATLFVVIGALTWVIPPGVAELLFLLLVFADAPGRLLVRRRERGQSGAGLERPDAPAG